MSKTPRYTDLDRYPHGYRKPEATDITITFRRRRAELAKEAEQQAKNEAEAKEKLRTMKKATK